MALPLKLSRILLLSPLFLLIPFLLASIISSLDDWSSLLSIHPVSVSPLPTFASIYPQRSNQMVSFKSEQVIPLLKTHFPKE